MISEHAPEDKITFLKKYAKQKEEEERKEISVPEVKSIDIEKVSKMNRQNVLRKQKELAERKIITGDGR